MLSNENVELLNSVQHWADTVDFRSENLTGSTSRYFVPRLHPQAGSGARLLQGYAAVCIQRFSKFLQHPVARARTVPSNQIAEGFKFCSAP